MYFEIDFDSGEAIYRQLCRQIVTGIAANTLHEGDSLPSVRDLASDIGINMHTVNKAYTMLKEEGFLTVDRRRGAIVRIDAEKRLATDSLRKELGLALARAMSRHVTREEIHRMVDEICEEYEE